MNIDVIQGSILEVSADAIVNAANSHGFMSGGVAGVIKRAAGLEVEKEATRAAPIPVGTALVTSGGATRFKAIVHAPTMREPGMRIPVDNVAQATRAALKAADERGFGSLALPGMGTGIGGVAHAEAARVMVAAVQAFHGRALQRVTFVDIDAAMVAAWRKELMAYSI
jgi:O-acetyl-ADP-ribose deacetylase (regulator of RNase III)